MVAVPHVLVGVFLGPEFQGARLAGNFRGPVVQGIHMLRAGAKGVEPAHAHVAFVHGCRAWFGEIIVKERERVSRSLQVGGEGGGGEEV